MSYFFFDSYSQIYLSFQYVLDKNIKAHKESNWHLKKEVTPSSLL